MKTLLIGTIILAITTVVIFLLKKLNAKSGNQKMEKIIKILAIAYCGLFLLGLLLPDGFIKSVGDNIEELGQTNYFHAILRIFTAITPIVLVIASFYKKAVFRNIAILVCLPATILSICSYSDYMQYLLSTSGRGLNNIKDVSEGFKSFMLNEGFRATWLVCQWSIGLIIPLKLLFIDHHLIEVNKKSTWINFLVITGCLLIQMCPIYVPQLLFGGYSKIIFDSFSMFHLLWIAYIPIKIIVLYFLFRKKDQTDKFILCLILALTVLIQYNSMFALTINIKRLPLQLCNIASYLMVIALITKNVHLFNFNFLVNVVGASLALLFPDVNGTGIFEVWNMHFIYEHTNVLVVPILCLCLGIFPKLNKYSYRDAVVGFASYFIFCIVIGTFLNGMVTKTGNDYYEVNYLFMFDKDAIVKILPALSFLTTSVTHFGYYQIYPNLVLFVFFGYLLLISLFYLPFGISAYKASRKAALKEPQNAAG